MFAVASFATGACGPGQLVSVDVSLVDSGTFDGGPGFDAGPQPDTGPGSDAGPGVDGSLIDAGAPDAFDAGPPPADPLAPVDVMGIAVFQTVAVTLLSEGTLLPPNAPIIAGRPMRVRATVTPTGGFSGSVNGRLTLSRGGIEAMYSDTLDVSGPQGELPADAFEFDVPPEWVGSDVSYAVSMHAPDGGGGSSRSRFPAGADFQSLGAVDAPAVEIHFVPLRYNADGSGRLPAVTTPSGLQALREVFEALLPTANLILEVTEPVDLSTAVLRRDGASWSDGLAAVLDARSALSPPEHVYYLGLVVPAETWGEYCGGACMAGLGLLNDANRVSARSAVSLGFEREGDLFTAIHEVGHAFGLPHAPCRAGGPDPEFPYEGGNVGVWGRDQRSGDYLPPDTADLMGYCRPNWFSDYNYNKCYERSVELGDGSAIVFAVPHVRVTIAPFRAPRFSPAELEVPATVEEGGVVLEAFGPDGHNVTQVVAHRHELSFPGMLQWLVPVTDGVASVALPSGQRLRF